MFFKKEGEKHLSWRKGGGRRGETPFKTGGGPALRAYARGRGRPSFSLMGKRKKEVLMPRERRRRKELAEGEKKRGHGRAAVIRKGGKKKRGDSEEQRELCRVTIPAGASL